MADSIVKALQGGASFAELAEVYSNDPGSKSKGGDLGVFAPSQMVPEFGDAVLANEKGKVFTVDSRFGTHIAEVTYLSKPTKKVQLATITYRIEPSQTTQQAVYANASKFIAEAHGSYENFDRRSPRTRCRNAWPVSAIPTATSTASTTRVKSSAGLSTERKATFPRSWISTATTSSQQSPE